MRAVHHIPRHVAISAMLLPTELVVVGESDDGPTSHYGHSHRFAESAGAALKRHDEILFDGESPKAFDCNIVAMAKLLARLLDLIGCLE
jgi:hypothetical protein